MPSITIHEAMTQAVRHHSAGELPAAEGLYRQVLATEPNHPDALHLLGVIAFQCAHYDVARELISRAIVINPADPNYPYNLAHVHAMSGNRPDAIAAYRRTIAMRPDFAEAYNNLGVVLAEDRNYSAAIEAYRKSLELNPSFADAWCNLSNSLRETGQIDAAIEAAMKANALQPDVAAGYNNLGAAFLRSGRFDEAIVAYQRALQLEPDFAMAHYNLAMALLMTGRLEEGWPHAEHRWRARELGLMVQQFAQPAWDGSPLEGKRILLHAEQGFGDAIHLVRYVPQVIARGGRVILAVQKPLTSLMHSVEGIEAVITDGDPLPPFDVHCPMLTLPMIFKTTLATIPAPIPYLHAAPSLIQDWKPRLGDRSDKRVNVGLVWAGSPEHKNDHNRSIPLAKLAPLAQIANVHFFSLQKGPAAAQLQSAPPGMAITDLGSNLNDFADAAAVLDQLDLLISVDTAPAHLAGALGKPVWMLVPFIPDWRWMLHREDSPWYPTMKLFRQPRPGEWGAPIGRLADELSRFRPVR